jgi:hypothetical protein
LNDFRRKRVEFLTSSMVRASSPERSEEPEDKLDRPGRN